MAPDRDDDPKLADYAHPERLVTTEWLSRHLDEPDLVVVESDEDVLLYETGHIPGAVKIDWHTDLQDPVARDYLDAEGFAALLSERGISRDSTLVFYGDNFNWWAAYALWVFSLFGHPDTRLLDGGRQAWEAEGRPMTTDKPARARAEYPTVERDDAAIRAFAPEVREHVRAGGRLVDVRSPQEYTGEVIHMMGYPQEGAQRGGHIKGARSIPWGKAANDDGTFKPVEELRALYEGEEITPDRDVIAYCRIGERSSHTWFVLTYLLGYPNVRNYDGSWTEYGSMVNVPIAKGEAPE